MSRQAGRQAGRQRLSRQKQRFKGDTGVVSAAMRTDDPEVSADLRAPFPWFGGKRRVAEMVWSRFGNVDTYNEPFAGSLAVLLARPHAPRIETVNDVDCFLANFWRGLQHDPEAVAYWADGPVNEADLHARHRWLVERGRRRVLRCARDPHYFNAKIAGWWVWGQCLWIGSGWCQTVATQRKRPAINGNGDSGGVHRQFDRNALGTLHQKRRPHLTSDQGALAQRTAETRSGESPHLQRKRFASTGNGQGTGVHRRWQGGGQGGGSGVHAPRLKQQKPYLASGTGNTDRGVKCQRSDGLYDYLTALAARLRRVRVCCGDWPRVLTPSVTTYIGITGVFLDPPYSHDLRERCYSEDHDISGDVRTWALDHGDDPKMRIALCGYAEEHTMPTTWECVPWKAHGGYSRSERGVANRSRERIWFSPHCLQPGLFGAEHRA